MSLYVPVKLTLPFRFKYVSLGEMQSIHIHNSPTAQSIHKFRNESGGFDLLLNFNTSPEYGLNLQSRYDLCVHHPDKKF
jgi:hypothetical protein